MPNEDVDVELGFINGALQERKKKFEQYEGYAESLEHFLNDNKIFEILENNKERIASLANGSTASKIWNGLVLAITNPVTVAKGIWNYGIRTPGFLGGIFTHIGEPEMQKVLVEKTSLLEKVGQHKDLVMGLANEFVFTGEDKNTKTLRATADAT